MLYIRRTAPGDMLFSTYENPETFTTSCGFDDVKEQRLLAMLAFQDVHEA